jgi:hypothetical protein
MKVRRWVPLIATLGLEMGILGERPQARECDLLWPFRE